MFFNKTIVGGGDLNTVLVLKSSFMNNYSILGKENNDERQN